MLLGATFGLGQAVVFTRHYPQLNRFLFIWWVVASSVGFMLGANLANRLTWMVVETESGVVTSAIYGLFLCIPFSIGQWAVLRWIIFKSSVTDWWLPTSVIAWFITEGVSGFFDHPLWFMWIFGLLIALFTGLVWVWRVAPNLDDGYKTKFIQ
jgi:hypothetical protein